MASLQTQMAKTVASAAGLTGSLPTAEARSDLASETPIEPRKEFRLPLFSLLPPKTTGTEFAEKPFKTRE